MPFDETKIYLGKLCIHNHDYAGTGKSLRYIKNEPCVECIKENQMNNKEQIKERKKTYNENNKEKLSERRKKYYEKNRDICIERQRKYNKNNIETVNGNKRKKYNTDSEYRNVTLNKTKEYVNNNKESVLKNKKIYYENNRETILKNKKIYNKKPEVKKRINESTKEYYKRYPHKKLNHNMSKEISVSLKGTKNGKHWEDIVGYTKEELMDHLEKQFYCDDGEIMCWDNCGKGGWSIDHAVPKTWFKFESMDDPEFKKCWSLENLQPMWGYQNVSKGNRYEGKYREDLDYDLIKENASEIN